MQQQDTLAFSQLKASIRQQGLLEARKPIYYMVRFALNILCIVLAGYVVFSVESTALKFLATLPLAFGMVQCAVMGHDASHRSVFKSKWLNDVLATFNFGVISALSYVWFFDSHHRHHAHSNKVGIDPNLDDMPFAFPEMEDVRKITGVRRAFVKHQAWFLLPLLSLAVVDFRVRSIRHMLSEQKFGPRMMLEIFLSLVHYAVFWGLPLYAMPVGQALLFILIYHMIAGLYVSTAFATNHMGMEMFEKDTRVDFPVFQAVGSRNIKSGPIVDYMLMGLNYQVEHHYFPTIASYNMSRIQGDVKKFCQQNNILYHEPGVIQTYREMLTYLHRAGAPLREPEAPPAAPAGSGA